MWKQFPWMNPFEIRSLTCSCVPRCRALDIGEAALVWLKVLRRSVQNEWPPPASPDSAFRRAAYRWAERGERQRQCELRRASVRDTHSVPAYAATGTSLKHTDHGPIRVWLLQGLGAGATVVRLRVLYLFIEWNVFVMRCDLTWSHSEIRAKPIMTQDSGCVSNPSEQPTSTAFWGITDAFRTRIRKAHTMSKNAGLLGSLA